MELPEDLVFSLNKKRHASEERYNGLLDMLPEAQDEETGNQLTLIEGTWLLALISQHDTLDTELDYPVEAELAITMRPKHGLHMRTSRC